MTLFDDENFLANTNDHDVSHNMFVNCNLVINSISLFLSKQVRVSKIFVFDGAKNIFKFQIFELLHVNKKLYLFLNCLLYILNISHVWLYELVSHDMCTYCIKEQINFFVSAVLFWWSSILHIAIIYIIPVQI